MALSLISLVNVAKTFGAIRALEPTNLDIDAGEVVGFMGDNGDAGIDVVYKDRFITGAIGHA